MASSSSGLDGPEAEVSGEAGVMAGIRRIYKTIIKRIGWGTQDDDPGRASKRARVLPPEPVTAREICAALRAFSMPFWNDDRPHPTNVCRVRAYVVPSTAVEHPNVSFEFIHGLSFEYRNPEDSMFGEWEGDEDEGESEAVDLRQGEVITGVRAVRYRYQIRDVHYHQVDSQGSQEEFETLEEVMRLTGLTLILSSGRELEVLRPPAGALPGLSSVTQVMAQEGHCIVALRSIWAADVINTVWPFYQSKSDESECIVQQPLKGGPDLIMDLLMRADLNNAEVLRAVREARSDLAQWNACHVAWRLGRADVLEKLLRSGVGELLHVPDALGLIPVLCNTRHRMAQPNGIQDISEDQTIKCMKVLTELAGPVALLVRYEDGRTLAHEYCRMSKVRQDFDGAKVLRAFSDLGLVPLLSPTDNLGRTPAHYAASVDCLRVLHEELDKHLRPIWQQGDFESVVSLMVPDLTGKTPAEVLMGLECLKYLSQIGGLEKLRADLAGDPTPLLNRKTGNHSGVLLSTPAFLDLPSKAAWLAAELAMVVQERDPYDVDGVQLSIEDWARPLHGVCEPLGVSETNGVIDPGAPVGLGSVQTLNVNDGALGDGLRRQWLERAGGELFDPRHGLFIQSPNGRIVSPNPHSGQLVPDHLSQFTLLGRILGLALLHREQVSAAASLNMACIKELLTGGRLTPRTWSLARCVIPLNEDHDIALLEPDTYEKKVLYLRKRGYEKDGMTIEDLCVFFVDMSEPPPEWSADPSAERVQIELCEGGAEKAVTESNVDEYLKLFCDHRMRQWRQSVEPQMSALLAGFRVLVRGDNRQAVAPWMEKCFTPMDLVLLLGGLPRIDDDAVKDWEQHTRYDRPLHTNSPLVRWFWQVVRAFSQEQRARLLQFSTGALSPPAFGFARLSGFNGAESHFTLSPAPVADPARLPTASTCMNQVFLPPYSSVEELRAKLCLAITCIEFNEGAVTDPNSDA